MPSKFVVKLTICLLTIFLTSCASQLAKTKVIDTACTDFEEIKLSTKTFCFMRRNIKDPTVRQDVKSIVGHNKVWKDKCKKELKGEQKEKRITCPEETRKTQNSGTAPLFSDFRKGH